MLNKFPGSFKIKITFRNNELPVGFATSLLHKKTVEKTLAFLNAKNPSCLYEAATYAEYFAYKNKGK